MKSIKPFLIFLFSVLLTSTGFGQTKKGLKLVKKKKFEKAKLAFEKDLAHPVYACVAYLQLADLNTRGKKTESDYLEAYQQVEQAEELYKALSQESKIKLRDQKNGAMKDSRFRNQKKSIQRRALRQIEKKGQIEPLDSFLAQYPEILVPHKNIEEAKKKIHRNLFRDVVESGTIFALDSFLQQYPNAAIPPLEMNRERNKIIKKYLDSSYEYDVLSSIYKNHRRFINQQNLRYKWDNFPTRLFNSFVNENGMENLDKFIEEHPDHWVAKDCWGQEFTEAYQDETANSLLEFLEDYPLSVLANLARDGARAKYRSTDTFSAKAQRRWETIKMGRKLNRQLLFDTADSTFQEQLMVYLDRAAPSENAYDLVEDAIEHFVSSKRWELANNLAVACKPLFPDVRPKKCWNYFTFHVTKQDYFNTITQIMSKDNPEVKLFPVEEVNTDIGEEYSPVVSADGSTLFFTATFKEKEENGEDVYMATFDFETRKWSAPKVVPKLSGPGNQAPLAITSNGDLLLVFVNQKLYTSELTASGWSAPKPFSDQINKFDWIGKATMSSDGNVIIFEASRKEDGVMYNEDINLFVSLKKPDGDWVEPFSIGSTINTVGQERSPFLHMDNETLYFSSDEHPGLGNLDVFVTKRLDKSWRRWSEPINLGKEINTIEDDWGYNFSSVASGQVAYLSSDDQDNRTSDIFATGLPEYAKPEKRQPVVIKLNREDGRPLVTTVVLEDAETGEVIDRIKTRPDGSGTFIPPAGSKIRYYVEDEQLFPTSKVIDLKERTEERIEDEPAQVISVRKMIKDGKPAPLNNLFFDHDKSDLKEVAKRDVEKVFKLIEKKNWIVEIVGHTDNEGSEEYNEELSYLRAESVRDYLVDLGIAEKRMKVKGYGSIEPVSENDTEEGRAKNRRVEIRFIVPDAAKEKAKKK